MGIFYSDKECVNCAYMDINVKKNGKYACTNRRSGYDEVFPEMSANNCNSFCDCLNSRRCSSDMKELIAKSKSARRYLVTAICGLLNIEDSKYDDAFDYFKNIGLAKIDDNNLFIEDYDELGPIVAEQMITDDNGERYAEYLRVCYLDKFVRYIENEDIDSAYEIYTSMYKNAKDRYKIKRDVKKLLKVNPDAKRVMD